jgi:hypothetical protein
MGAPSDSYQHGGAPSSGNMEEGDSLLLSNNAQYSQPVQFENTSSSSRLRRNKKTLLLGLGAVLVVATAIAVCIPSSRAAVVNDVEMLGSSLTGTAKPCTFDECAGSNCNYDKAPFTCLFHNGGVHGGCSATPWAKFTCTTQCDLTDCASLEIPKGTKDCKQECSKKWCDTQQGRLCDDEKAPYQCTDGASTYGCSADPYHWTIRVSATACSSCCEATLCEEIAK